MSGQKHVLEFFECKSSAVELRVKNLKTLRIGNAGGFWGDDPLALKRQIEKGKLDYISIDFLAEITMSIMQKQYSKDPSKGYAYDFVAMLRDVLAEALARKTKIITNAGGINPQACAKAIVEMARGLGLSPKIAVVYGDDILAKTSELESEGVNFLNMETGEEFSTVRERIEAANVYFGAMPIVEALEKWDPDLIITGRVTDTGITLAPMIYEFAWSKNDWDKLASGIVAGHLLECGTQVTGGNFSDWQKVENYNEMGFPIVEVNADGSFIVSKHENTGGLVSVDTVREQLFYEMGDPHAYLTPDVVADFASIRLKAVGKNRVQVSGVKGYEPTSLYKISMAYRDGFKCSGSVLISGPEARKKAEKFSEIFWQRCAKESFIATSTEYIGWNSCHRTLGHQEEAPEILLRLSVRAVSDGDIKLFRKLISSLILSGPPGVTVFDESIGKVHAVMSYWPALLPKNLVLARIALAGDLGATEAILSSFIMGQYRSQSSADQVAKQVSRPLSDLLRSSKAGSEGEEVFLYKLCLARSGDKGDTANIGVLARSDKAYAFLQKTLTAQWMKDLFQEFCDGAVTRFSLEHLRGLNFLLDKSLGGGGGRSLRADAQGKTFSQALLRQKVFVPLDLAKELNLYPMEMFQ